MKPGDSDSINKEETHITTCSVSIKWTKLFALIGVWMAMGMSHSMASATLPDLRQKVGMTVEEAGRAFAIGSVGGIVGALLGSLADRYNNKADIMLALLVIGGALALVMKPLCNNLWTFSLVCFVEGVTWTCVNAVGNPMVLALWGEKSGSPMQALHFGYPVGSMIGPLVAYPFVSKPLVNDSDAYTTTVVYTIPNGITISPYLPTEELTESESSIEIAYAIVGTFGICIGLVFMVYQFFFPFQQHQASSSKMAEQTTSWKQVFSPSQWGGGDALFGGIMVSLIMLFYFVNMASIKASTLYYTSYAVEGPLAFTNQEGTLYSSAFNLAGLLGRASTIVAALVLPVVYLLPVAVCGQALGSIVTLLWGIEDKLGFVVTSCIYSYFSFPVWPLGYAWADVYIFLFAIVIGLADVTSKLSDTIFGYLLAYLYEYTVKESIFYNTVVASILLILVVLVMTIFGNRHGSKYKLMVGNKLSSGQELSLSECTKL